MKIDIHGWNIDANPQDHFLPLLQAHSPLFSHAAYLCGLRTLNARKMLEVYQLSNLKRLRPPKRSRILWLQLRQLLLTNSLTLFKDNLHFYPRSSLLVNTLSWLIIILSAHVLFQYQQSDVDDYCAFFVLGSRIFRKEPILSLCGGRLQIQLIDA